jgi:hypothetical protein
MTAEDIINATPEWTYWSPGGIYVNAKLSVALRVAATIKAGQPCRVADFPLPAPIHEYGMSIELPDGCEPSESPVSGRLVDILARIIPYVHRWVTLPELRRTATRVPMQPGKLVGWYGTGYAEEDISGGGCGSCKKQAPSTPFVRICGLLTEDAPLLTEAKCAFPKALFPLSKHADDCECAGMYGTWNA